MTRHFMQPTWRTRFTDYMRLMRLDRPIGSLLLLWPTWWALWMAADGFPSIANLIIFTLGVFMMRAAGCAINDFADRKVDGHVKRTQSRPLATGRVRPVEAVILFLTLALLSFLMVVFFTNRLTLYLSFVGLVLAFIYPFMKRYTHLPQLFLGAAFSWAIPMAWAAEAGEITRIAGLLFVANVLWIMVYDTIYAMVDRDDDERIGVKSTAILFGQADKAIIAGLQVATVLTLALVGSELGLGIFYFLGLVGMAVCFAWQQHLIRFRERDACFRAFLNNQWAGASVFAGVLLTYLG